jgi:hypothetical protein
MRTGLVITLAVFMQDVIQVALMEDEKVVQTFLPHARGFVPAAR